VRKESRLPETQSERHPGDSYTTAKSAGLECSPGTIAFMLTDSGSEFIWQGVKLSIYRLANAGLRGHPGGDTALPGHVLLQTISLNSQTLQGAFFEDSSALLNRGGVRLASNVRGFRKTVLAESGRFDVEDNSHCRSHQINLHCGDLSISCRLTVLDPAEVITP
jgi:hypothetical protein